jgi:hypothetical protein
MAALSYLFYLGMKRATPASKQHDSPIAIAIIAVTRGDSCLIGYTSEYFMSRHTDIPTVPMRIKVTVISKMSVMSIRM